MYSCVCQNEYWFYLALNDVSVRSYAVADRTPILSLSSWCKNVRVMWLWCNMQVLSHVDSLHNSFYMLCMHGYGVLYIVIS